MKWFLVGLFLISGLGVGAHAQKTVIDGTVAYWQFTGADGEPVSADNPVKDLSGNGNDLVRVDMPSGRPHDMVWSEDRAETMPSKSSLRISGNNETRFGAYLQTAEDALLNSQTFENGFTVEAFVKLPKSWNPDLNAWTGIISRKGSGADIGKDASDPSEPVGHLAVSNFPEFQWAVWPVGGAEIMTNWSDQLELGRWYHVAIVNDGSQSLMYVDGEEVLRNPPQAVVGISTAGLPWMIGGSHYANETNSFNGWIGDVRIVDRALAFDEFLTTR